MPFQPPPFPSQLSIDTKSRHTLMGAAYGNCFCAIMSIPQGTIYVAPYTKHQERPGWKPDQVATATEYPTHGAMCAGEYIPNNSIYHQEGGIAGHLQLSEHVLKHSRELDRATQVFVGFSLLFCGKGFQEGESQNKRDGVGPTSRSHNNPVFAPPPEPGVINKSIDGSLPEEWTTQIAAYMRETLHEFKVMTSTEYGFACDPVRMVAAPPPPPPPPPPRRV